MATSEERREVARKLRELTVCDGVDAFDIAKALRLEAVSRTEYDTESVRRLADLIEPQERTCKVVGTISMDWSDGSTVYSHELSCGHTRKTSMPEPPAFCDECGARVVSE